MVHNNLVGNNKTILKNHKSIIIHHRKIKHEKTISSFICRLLFI